MLGSVTMVLACEHVFWHDISRVQAMRYGVSGVLDRLSNCQCVSGSVFLTSPGGILWYNVWYTVYFDYPGADYSVCGLSVHDSFFNLPSIWFIKLRTINIYTEYLVHKSGYVPVWLISCAREHTGSGKCVRRARFSVCV